MSGVASGQEVLSLVFYFFFFSIEVCLRFFLISFKKKLFCMSSAASVGEAGLCLFSLFLCLVSLFVHLFLYHIFTDLFPEKSVLYEWRGKCRGGGGRDFGQWLSFHSAGWRLIIFFCKRSF